MARRTVDMEPSVAFAEMLTAMAAASRYAGHGVRTTGKRVGRRARVAGTEASRRAALAARVLSGRPMPERRPRPSLIVVATAAAAGAAAAVAMRQSVFAVRARVNGNGGPASEEAAGDGSRSGARRAEADSLLRGVNGGAD
jgi:hypothetical protein